MKNKPQFRTFQECLIESLQDPEEAQAYLEVVLEKYVETRNTKQILRTINYIAIAQNGNLVQAQSSDIDTTILDALLEQNPNPTWEQVIEVLGYDFVPSSSEAIPSY